MKNEYTPSLIYGDFFKEYKYHLKAKQTDLFLSDIPYGLFAKEKSLKISNIDPVIDIEELENILDYCMTITGTVLLFCDFELLVKLKQTFQIFEYRYHYVLEKSVSMPKGKYRPIENVEYIAVFHRKKTKPSTTYFYPFVETGIPYQKRNYNLENPLRKQTKRKLDINESGERWIRSVIQVSSKCNLPKNERSKHKFQKSEYLLRKMINIYSIPDSLVVDGFAGCGSALISAYKENRRSIGFEINKENHLEANQRINETVNQLKLI